MRVVKGIFKGYQFKQFKGSHTRPTTDYCKESLFSFLENNLDFNQLQVLDLYSGTGNVSLEFLSRGAISLVSVDSNNLNTSYINNIKKELNINQWEIYKQDAIQYLLKNEIKFNLIFADPPYNDPNVFNLINTIVHSTNFLQNNVLFILEHETRLKFNNEYLFLNKEYGNTTFSFFKFSKTL